MANTIANVLTGVATLAVRQPNDARAEWVTTAEGEVYDDNTYSVRLYKGGSGNDGSTHVEIDVTARALTFTQMNDGWATSGFYHFDETTLANWAQMEFRFEDPDSPGWIELTAVPLQTDAGIASWEDCPMADTTPSGVSGETESGLSLFNWALANLSTQMATLGALCDDATCADWVLTRVRIELWEATPERTSYVTDIEVLGITYTTEPGGTGPAISLGSPSTDLGYTEDGVTLTYTADEADVDVEEETFSIDRVITKETLEVTCNMAESSLANIGSAMAGAAVSANILRLGNGVNKTMNLRIKGVNPAGFVREIIIPKATTTGAVGMSYKKGSKTIVPVTFRALKPANGIPCTIVDNAV